MTTSDIAAEIVVKFLQQHESFSVYKSSSADDTDNILAQRDLLLLVENAFEAGYKQCFEDGYGD